MKIIVDTNRIIAALIGDSNSRKILNTVREDFITIGLTKKEIDNHMKELLKKTGLSSDELDYLLNKVLEKTITLSDDLIEVYMPEAKNIMDAIDKDDTPFVAAAIASDASIWSDDAHFTKQKRIKILKTKDLVKYLP